MISVSQAFHRTSANPVDDTLTLTKSEMLAINDNLMPSKYLTVCQDDGCIYLYDKSATPNQTTGKFTKFEGSGGGGGSESLPMVDTLPTASSEYNLKAYMYTGENDTTNGYYKGVIYQCRINPDGDAYVWYPYASNIADGYFIWREPIYYDTTSSLSPLDNPKFKAGIKIRTDSTPTSGSINFVNSGGIYNALSGKQDSDVYSTSEKAVGKWINGATIYRRTYTGTLSSSTGNYTVQSSFSYTPIKYEGVAFSSSMNVPINATANGGSSSVSISPFKYNGALMIANSNSMLTGASYYLTVYYLK